MTKALLIIDMQNDFMPGGPLAVAHANAIIPLINRLAENFPFVVASQDWHPEDHMSFAKNHPGKKEGDVIEMGGSEQILWPVHCVQNTEGAKLVTGLDLKKIDRVIQKGTDKWIDSYSVFFDNAHRKTTPLKQVLDEQEIDTVYLVGVATDYCLFFSAIDALNLGFKVVVVQDACRAINLKPGDEDKAFQTLEEKGAQVITSDLLK